MAVSRPLLCLLLLLPLKLPAATYIATPSKPHSDVGILFLTDAMGIHVVNSQLLADQFAANGYLTLMPDLLHGDAVPMNLVGNFDFMKWVSGAAGGGEGEGHGIENVEAIKNAAMKHMREEMGVTRFGAVGYCFGGKYVVRGLGSGDFAVGYTAHPSLVEKEELRQVKGPLSIAAADKDHVMTTELRHESEAILKELGTPYQINLYGGSHHGFAVRADIKKPQLKFAQEQAFFQAVQWMDQWLLAKSE